MPAAVRRTAEPRGRGIGRAGYRAGRASSGDYGGAQATPTGDSGAPADRLDRRRCIADRVAQNLAAFATDMAPKARRVDVPLSARPFGLIQCQHRRRRSHGNNMIHGRARIAR